MITEDQRKERKSFIGGSDTAAVLGLSRWKTPLEVWAEKTGQIEPEDVSDRVCIKLGNAMEQIVADFFMDETGKKVVRKNETIIHPEYPFLAANIDRRVVGERALLECKTASAFKTKEWEDGEIPIEYIYQCVHYLAVTGYERAYLAVIIGNTQFKWMVIERDEELIKSVIEREVAFWDEFIFPKIMPAVISEDAEILTRLFPNAKPESTMELTDEFEEIVKTIKDNELESKRIEDFIDLQKNKLRNLIGENETALGKTYQVTWKNQKTTRVNTDHLKKCYPEIYSRCTNETNSRVLRISNVKKPKVKKEKTNE